jgi:spermidine/putrescine transport system ATP-binding protein
MSRVRIAGVTKRFGQTIAVDNVTLDVAEGEFVTLLGPSGCGKTTCLRIVAGLAQPTSGAVYFDEQDVTRLSPRARNIGFVFQAPALFPHLSVADNIAFGLAVKGRGKDAIKTRVDEMLTLVGLAEFGKRLPAQLSGGQQQRVALARVLATDPRVLLFDEPLSALDKNLRDTLKYSILDLQRSTNKTAIYVTHDQSEAFAISDRIVVMNGGRIEQVGTQTDIYVHPETPFVAEFIGANNSLAATVLGTEGEGESACVLASVDGMTLRCHGRSEFSAGQAVLAYIRPENVVVLGESEGDGYENVLEGEIDRVIFEGPTAQMRVDVGGRVIRADIAGHQRLTVVQRQGRVRLGFNEVTLIAAPGKGPADRGSGVTATTPDNVDPPAQGRS